MLGEGPEISGRVNAQVQVQGTATNPEMTASLTTGALTLAGQSYAGLSAWSSYRSEHLNLNLLLRQDETHTLSVEGGMPITLKGGDGTPGAVLGKADLRLRSEGLSLAFLGLLHKQIQEVQGTASMDVNLSGPLDALAPSGSVRIQQGLVRVKALGQAFSSTRTG
jgi:autotransporter translocation and assembly factor TamB